MQGNGIYCLTEILFDQSTPVALRAEAAGVVAQVTSPLLDHCHKLQGFMENLEELIYSLTGKSFSFFIPTILQMFSTLIIVMLGVIKIRR